MPPDETPGRFPAHPSTLGCSWLRALFGAAARHALWPTFSVTNSDANPDAYADGYEYCYSCTHAHSHSESDPDSRAVRHAYSHNLGDTNAHFR